MSHVSGTKSILRVSAVALICFTSPCTRPAVAGDSTNFPNPIHGGERWNQDKRDSANENLTWKLVQSHLQNLLCMSRKQIQAAFGQAKFISSRQHEDDLEGYEIEQDAVLQLAYNAGNVVYYEFIRPKDAQRFKLPVTVSGPHCEPSHRSNSDSSAQEIKNQTVFSSNLPVFIGMSRAEILTLFGAPRKEPRIKSDPEFDCEQGILAFSFDQDKVTKFSFRSYDIEAAVHSPPPTVKDARH